MARLDERFAELARAGKKALVAYVCVGFPSVEESIDLAIAAARAGADVLELGVPFSDPVADGPVIARASAEAIRRGASLRRALDAATTIRAAVSAPIVLFGYFNPIFVFGEKKLAAAANEAGVDALLVVDLPPEEGEELRDEAARLGLAIVPLLAPTSDEARVAAALSRASGFVYYVSVTGVTGSAGVAPLEEAGRAAAALRKRSGLPVVVGFGIDGGEKARLVVEGGADGVVVGTAIVRAIEEGRDGAERRKRVGEVVGGIRRAIDG